MTDSSKIRHMDTVFALTSQDIDRTLTIDKEPLITESWARCVTEHRLDPSRPRKARILTSTVVREHRERVERFLHVARFGIEQLYRQVAGLGYVLLLTDSHGVTVDYLGDSTHRRELRQAGLYLGADWNERHAGTCGVGTAIATGQALICHLNDHFDANHINLTCTASPLYDPFGQLLGVLDISILKAPGPKSTQHLALELVRLYARKIENANFIEYFRHHWLLRLSRSPEFVELDPDYLLAVGPDGRIAGYSRNLKALLASDDMVGQPLDTFFDCQPDDLPRLLTADNQHRTLMARRGERLYVSLSVPRARTIISNVGAPEPAESSLPAALQKLCGSDTALADRFKRAIRLVNAGLGILLAGETGTGKEVTARALHESGNRAGKPFVAINCAALPEALIESELFGYAPGAFTGARNQGKSGLIQEANGGTLFLDEIGDMPLALQARLLRVLAQREVLPIGGRRPEPIDIQVMAASHCDLTAMIAEGRFREDLFYRLNGYRLELPPLRDRTDKRFLIERIVAELAEGNPPRLNEQVMTLLCDDSWPGNIRELRTVLQFALAIHSGQTITVADLPDRFQSDPPVSAPASALAADDPARQLRDVLAAQHWNITATARQLGVARITVYRQMNRYGLVPPNHRER